MPGFTNPHEIAYPVASDLVKASDVTAKLAEDIKATAVSAGKAITAEGARAAAEAKAYADENNWSLTAETLLSSAQIYDLAPGPYAPISPIAASAIGLPSSNYGFLDVKQAGSSGKILTWWPISSDMRFYQNTRVGSTNWIGWQEYRPIGGNKGAGGVEREMRVAQANARRGGVYGTGGLAVFGMMFDHGTNNFVSKILPLLKKWGLPAGLGLNSQMYDPAYIFNSSDNATTFAQLQDIALNNGIAIWNHGRLHNAGGGSEIIGGRDELNASLPLIPVENWLHTGTYGDFASGSTFAKYWENDVGSVIVNSHAYLTGDIQEPVKSLSGQLKPGYDGTWVDAGQAALDTLKAQIQAAQAVGGGVMMRQHPMYIDTTGYLTSAQLDPFLGWVAGERDAGRLLVLTPDLLNLADATTSVRRNLVNGTGGTGDQTRTVIISDNPLVAGSVNEAHATVKLSTAGSVRVKAQLGSSLNAERIISIPANTWVDVRCFFTVPIGVVGTMYIAVQLVTGTGLTVHQLNVYPG